MQTYLSSYGSINKGIYGNIPIHCPVIYPAYFISRFIFRESCIGNTYNINNNFNRNIMKIILNQEVLREKMSKNPDKKYIQRLQNADDLNRQMFSDTGRLMSLKVFNGKYPGTKLNPMTKEVMTYIGGLRIELLSSGMWLLPLVEMFYKDNTIYDLESKLFRHFFGN